MCLCVHHRGEHLWRCKRRCVAADEQTSGLAGPNGSGVRWNHNIPCVPVRSGIPGNTIKDDGMAIKCAVAASPWTYGVGNSHSYTDLRCFPDWWQLCRMGIPSDVQCAQLTEIARKERYCMVDHRRLSAISVKVSFTEVSRKRSDSMSVSIRPLIRVMSRIIAIY